MQDEGEVVRRPRESEVLQACLFWLRVHGIFAERFDPGMKPTAGGRLRISQRKGISDILGTIPRRIAGVLVGQFLAVECKRPGGPGATPEQLKFGADVVRHGGIFIVARCTGDLEAVLGRGIYR